MADFGGIQLETPQEVMQRIQQVYNRGLQSGNPDVRRQFQIRSAIDSLFGGPREVRQAQEAMDTINAKMKESLSSLPSDASPEDRAAARFKAFAEAGDELNRPDISLQAAQQLLGLSEAQFQRSRLQDSDSRAEELHGLNKHRLELQIEDLEEQLDRQQRTGEFQVFLGGTAARPTVDVFDLSREGQVRARDAFALANPDAIPLTGADAARVLYPSSRLANRVGLVEARQQRDMTQSVLRAARLSSQFLKILRSNPTAFTAGEITAGVGAQFARHVEGLARSFKNIAMSEGHHSENLSRLNAAMDKANIDRTVMSGIMMNMAYALARQNDDGGRLSDNDIQFALQMLGGENPDPRALTKTLEVNVINPGKDHLGRLLRTADPQFDADILELQATFGEMDELIGSFNLGDEPPGPLNPNVPGTGPFETEDGIKVGR